ncbi:SDR family oxidoreductase [Kiritimatiellaeota bacterium B1221]|nr:SDR family oxidoreductase [Kiritimatiellaeota bacterium B1221]
MNWISENFLLKPATARMLYHEVAVALPVVCDVIDMESVQQACREVTVAWPQIDILINGAGGKIPKSITDHNAFTPGELDGSSYGFFNMEMDAVQKERVINFTQWLACYLAPAGIRVNAVAPGFFLNDRSRKLLLTEDGGFSPRGQQVIQHTPMGRFGEAHEMCGAVRWLLDDEAAAYVTGICVPVDGGFLRSSGL